LSESIVSGIVGLIDGLTLLISGIVYYLAVVGWSPETYQAYLAATLTGAGLTIGVLRYAGLYDFNTVAAWPSRMRDLVMLVALVALALCSVALAFKIDGQFSRLWFFAVFGTSAVVMGMGRGAAILLVRRWAQQGVLVRNVAIVGAGGQGQHLVSRLKLKDAPWKRIVGVFDDRRTRIDKQVDGIPVLGDLDDLVTYVRRGQIHDVIITLPWSADTRLISIISKLRSLPVHIYLGSDLIGYHFPRHREQLLEGVPVLEIASAPLTGWSGLVKRVTDLIVATAACVLLAPLLGMISLAVRLDSPGPSVFRQKRYGFNNEVIVVYKYRTMYHGRPPERGTPQAQKDDPRVTRVGRFLRKTSLDELPQLFNVLQGSMSIVGPRPHAIEHNEQYAALIGDYYQRHNVKPGITGWAQVNGFRGETDTIDKMEGRVDHDIYYIENWSLWMDIKIILLTAFSGWSGKNAY
jgi:Undecaprenyl-phosphate glucose phosphotransferase